MAERADGTVYINSSIDTTGLKPGGKEIEAACKRMAKSVADMGNKVKTHTQEVAVTLVQQNRLYAEQAEKVERLKQQMEELREQKVTTTEFQKLEKQIVKDSEDLEKMISLQKEFVEMGGSKDDSYYTDLQARIEQLGNKIEEAKKKKEDLMQSGEAYTGETVNTADTEEYRNAVKEYEVELANLNKLGMGVQASFARLAQKVQQFGGTVSGVYRLKGTLEELKNIGKMVIHPIQTVKDAFSSLVYRIKDSAAGLGASVINGLLHPFQTLKSVAVPALNKLGSAAKSAAKSIGSKLVTSLKKAASAALGVKKHTNGVGHSFKQMLKYSLGISSLLMLFRKIKNAVKDGMQNLAQYSGETNTHLSALKSSMTQLKNSLATAFNPILTVIEPILTRFINLLSQAATYVGMFFAALTGQKSFTKAVAVQEDYAASLGDTADGAKEAQKYLSGLDEIRTYSEDKDISAGGNGSVDPSQMFETVDIPGFVGDWVQKFKDAWNNADFSEIGSIVGGKLKSALEIIPWESIKATCNNIAQSLATFINGFVATPGLWKVVGVTIGKGINTATGMWNMFFDVTNFIAIGAAIATALNNALQTIDAKELGKTLSQKIRALIDVAYGFVTTFDWSGFGTWIGQAINGFFDNIDFSLAAQTLSQGIIGALNGLTAAIQKVDWYGLGQKVKEFLVNIDWGGIIGAMFEAIGAALGGLAMFLWGIIEDAWNSVVDWWHDVAFEDGQFTFQGLLDGLKEKWTDITNWIEEKIKWLTDKIKSIIDSIGSFKSAITGGLGSAIGNVLNNYSINTPNIQIPISSISKIPTGNIPYLATGAVIPPNAPFLAVLGDQKRGTNVEAPLSLIEDSVNKAVRNAMGNQQRGGTYIFEAQLDRRTIFRQVIEEAKLRQMVSGRNPFELA